MLRSKQFFFHFKLPIAFKANICLLRRHSRQCRNELQFSLASHIFSQQQATKKQCSKGKCESEKKLLPPGEQLDAALMNDSCAANGLKQKTLLGQMSQRGVLEKNIYVLLYMDVYVAFKAGSVFVWRTQQVLHMCLRSECTVLDTRLLRPGRMRRNRKIERKIRKKVTKVSVKVMYVCEECPKAALLVRECSPTGIFRKQLHFGKPVCMHVSAYDICHGTTYLQLHLQTTDVKTAIVRRARRVHFEKLLYQLLLLLFGLKFF